MERPTEGSLDPDELVSPPPARGFFDELKNGVSILVHVGIGKVEPATMRLMVEDDTEKLVIKTNRQGWRAWCCACRNRYYVLGPGHLEPMPRRMHSMTLSASVKRISAGDREATENMFKRSLSLLRRYPKAESIDLTFSSSNMEERLRIWANSRLTIDSSHEIRHSSREILSALAGRSPSNETDAATAASETGHSEQSSMEDPTKVRPSPLTRAASVYPAPPRGERGGSFTQLRSQPERMAFRRGSTSPDMPDLEGEGKNTQLWTWKEPPTLRKMDSTRGRHGGRGQHQWSPGAASGLSPSPGSTRSLGSELSLRRADASGPSSSGPRVGPQPKVDFWDPLGLLSDIESRSPPPPPLGKKSLSQPAPSDRSLPLHPDAARKPLAAESTQQDPPSPQPPQQQQMQQQVDAGSSPPGEGEKSDKIRTE